MKAKVIDFVHQESTGLVCLELEKPSGMAFLPGNFISISVDGGEERLYSIASSPTEDLIRIIFRVYKKGSVTPKLIERLLSTKEGIRIGEPSGFFDISSFIDNTDRKIYASTGTGISPIISVIGNDRKVNKLLVFQGVRDKVEEKFFQTVLERAKVNLDSIKIIFVHSRELEKRYVQDYIKEHGYISPNYRYALCGLDSMIFDTSKMLIEQGVHWNRIDTEVFYTKLN